jgi:predicted unusual protein kinase regulating ubiquinone biosynthesis (AarF/ABC1/UbiB family)
VARARAREAADLVASLGPAFIKAGQALSTRPDIVPPLLLEELAQLQDQLPGFDSALAMACIEDDLGATGGARSTPNSTANRSPPPPWARCTKGCSRTATRWP